MSHRTRRSRSRVQHQFAFPARGRLREAQLRSCSQDQDRQDFDLGRRARGACDQVRATAQDHRVPRDRQVEEHLLRCAPKLIDPRTGRVHTTLNQAVSATGRLSSTNPNLQNIPIRSELGRRIRPAFVASPGYKLRCRGRWSWRQLDGG
jgi:hypothetical protein